MMQYFFQAFSEHTAIALGWTIIHSLWQGALIALIMSFYLSRYKRENAVIRYRIAFSALFMVCISSLITYAIYATSSNHISDVVIFNSSQEGLYLQQFAPLQNGGGVLSGISSFLSQHFTIISGLWLLGALIFSLRFIGGYFYVQSISIGANSKLGGDVEAIFNQLKSKIKLHRNISVLETHKVDMPMMLGSIRPIILLPLGMINQLNLDEVEAVLAHELAHIIRNDYLLNIIQSIIEILFYYHPAVWWISANIRSERENCCDDYAVRLCGNPVNYAKTLLKIQEMKITHIPNLAIPFSGKNHNLLDRISRVLNQPQNRSQLREKLGATVLLFSAILCFASSNNYNTVKPDPFAIHLNTDLMDYNKYLTNQKPVLLNVAAMDTIPRKKKKKITIEKQEDQQEIKIKIEDGEIKEMIIDGKEIEEKDYDKYKNLYEGYSGERNIWIWGDEGEKMHWNFSEDEWEEWGKKWEKNWDDQEWSEYWEKQGKKWEEFSKKWTEEWDDEKFEKQWKENWDEEKWAEEWEKNWDSEEFTEKYKDMAKELSEKMSEFNFNFDFKDFPQIEMGDFPHFDFDFSFGPKVGDLIINELWEDGLLKEGRENNIELTDKYLKINGKKQSDASWKKYKELYEGKMGFELSEGSKIKYKIGGEKPEQIRKVKRI